MERFWNIIHYFLYVADYKFHLFFNKINPVVHLYKMPFAKKHFERKGIDPIKELNKAFSKPSIGLSSMVSGGLVYFLVFLVFFSISNLYSAILRKELNLKIYHFILFALMSFIVNYFLLFKEKKYLAYFKEFERMTKMERIKWAWISFLVVISILLFAIGSFIFMDYQLQ
jgi:hypothetical protein